MPLSAADYLIGAVATILVVATIGWGAWRLRCRVVPDWDGALARTAEATIAFAALVITGQLLAALHSLRPLPTLLTLVVVGAAMGAMGARPIPTQDRPAGRADRAGRLGVAVTAVAGAAVVAQWAAHTAVALDGGMTQLDTLYYHGPYTARFLQTATIGDLAGVGTSGSRLYPLDTELLHAIFAMPFGTDLASPLVSLVFLAVVGVAAWAIGQPHGMGATALLGALVAVSFPAFVATQAGQSLSDLAAAAFLAAAAAMLLAGKLRPGPTTIAGVAAGLAVGSKLSVAAPIAILTVGVIAVGARRHGAAVVGWCLGGLGVAGAWLARNWVLVDNPVPWFNVHLGPVRWTKVASHDAPPLLETVTDLTAWRTTYLPAIPQSMGRAWPLVLALLLGGVAVLAVRRPGVVRVVAVAVLVSVAAHVITPQTGGAVFRNNLRFLHPVLLLAGTLVALVVAGASARVQRITLGVLGCLVLVNLTSPHEARVPMWPGDAVPVAVAVGAGASVLALVLLAAWRRQEGSPVRAGWIAPLAAVTLVVLVIGVGWPVQRHYLRTRYQSTDLPRIDFYRPLQEVRDARIAVLGSPEVYPMFGPDLSNEVSHLTNKDRAADLAPCLAWRQALVDRYDYVAVLPFYFVPMDMEIDELTSDPAATVVTHTELGTLYRIDGPIATDVCRADQAP